ncbi:MAG: hypothetical protein DWI59_01870 [Chloroflexi bacterium]|nr:MAG: hypothetical protein DWI59_01870 [Chloroflexota bacterium]
MRTTIRLLYALAIAIFFVITVGFGTFTFYPGPERPTYPEQLQFPKAQPVAAAPTPDAQAEAAQQKFYEDQQAFESAERVHGGGVMLVAAATALIAIAVGLAASSLLDVLRAGVMLGGLLTAIWGVIYASSVNAASRPMIFVSTLTVLILLSVLSTERARHWLGRTMRLGVGDDLLH